VCGYKLPSCQIFDIAARRSYKLIFYRLTVMNADITGRRKLLQRH